MACSISEIVNPSLIPFPFQPIETIQGSYALRPPKACLGSFDFLPHLKLTIKDAMSSEFNAIWGGDENRR